MDLRYFQSELNKYPVKRRSDYCKAHHVKSNNIQAPKALTNSSTIQRTEMISSVEDEDLNFWEYLNSKLLYSDDLQLTQSEQKTFTKTFLESHKAAIAELKLEDLEIIANLCDN